MSGHCYEVPPLKRVSIRATARKIRSIACELAGQPFDPPYFDVFRFLDVVLPRHWEEFTVEVIEPSVMSARYGTAHAITIPADQTILVHEDIWSRAEAGEGRDRMTLAHELGHLVLHARASFARKVESRPVATYRQSEWQADAFAGELLMAAHHLGGCRGPEDLMVCFGVTFSAAQTQWKAFQRDGLV